jgi:proteasome assembly chaperone (PAC2) family protein
VFNLKIRKQRREETMHRSIRILNRIEPRSPVLIAAWPGMGNVAFGAAMYLKETLQAEKFAEIDPQDIFYRTGVQIREGVADIPALPKSEFYYYPHTGDANDLIIFIGESQPVMEKEYKLAQRVVDVAVEYGVEEVITFAATPVNISHRAEPGVWGVTTEHELQQKLKEYGVRVMSAGHIGGLNGLLLGVAKSAGLRGFCLLGEIPFYTAKIENPKSSLSILKVFMSYRNVAIDFDGLEQMAKFVEEEVEKVSKTTKQTILEQNPAVQPGDEADYDVSDDEGAEAAPEPSPGETPPEIRERIEFLFEAAAKDLSKAGDLKDELDHWGLFQEYEDRFLDLFGKRNL